MGERLSYTTSTSDAWVMAQHLWALVPLGLVGTSVARQPQRLDFSCSEMELSCLVVDETLGT